MFNERDVLITRTISLITVKTVIITPMLAHHSSYSSAFQGERLLALAIEQGHRLSSDHLPNIRLASKKQIQRANKLASKPQNHNIVVHSGIHYMIRAADSFN